MFTPFLFFIDLWKQEEQYQEIQELRRHLGELREENSGLKTRTRRLEEDLIRRDRQIEQLMDPAKVGVE